MKQTTRDNLIYLAVGLSIAGLVAADAFYAVSRDREMWMPSRFALRVVYTTMLLGYFVATETRKAKATVLQVFTYVLFGSIVHLSIVFGFRQGIDHLSGLSFSALAVIELFLVVQLLLHVAQYLRSR